MAQLPIVVGITGASGSLYAKRLLDVLLAADREVHVAISPAAIQVLKEEVDPSIDLKQFNPRSYASRDSDKLIVWNHQDLSAGIASGSFRTAGMVVVPCSTSTLAAIAHGQAMNLIHRAADVHLKERRKLILVPRETPLSLITIENMAAVTRAGAVVLPAMPGFYHQPQSIDDLVNFVVGRICDQLEVENHLMKRWGSASIASK